MKRTYPRMKISRLMAALTAMVAVPCLAGAATIEETFDSFPGGGTGWSANWVSGAVTTALSTTTPLNAGGSYLTVSTTADSSAAGVRRDIGSVAQQPYTLTFDFRWDTPASEFNVYADRIQLGTTSANELGSTASWKWLIGVVGGDNGVSNPYTDGIWYFYDNTSTSANGAFSVANMVDTGIALTTGVTYSFTVDVDPAAQKYSASMSGSDSSFFSKTGMDFRNQTEAGTNGNNLVFANARAGQNQTFSLDNISIVPEPSSIIVVAAGGLLLAARHRR